MPTPPHHPGHRAPVAVLLLDLLLFLAPWAHRRLPEPRPNDPNDFSTRRIGIASAICIREHGTEEIDEYSDEVEGWLARKNIPYARRLLLIQAGYRLGTADERLDEWDDDALRAMIALNRMAI